MAILSINQGIPGLVGLSPSIWVMKTNNTTAELLASGFLNNAHAEQLSSFANADVVAATVVNANVATTAWYNIRVTGLPGAFIYSLVAI